MSERASSLQRHREQTEHKASGAPVTAVPLLALLPLSVRNLWRNRRRTWLTVAGIAFAVFLMVFARSLQDGSFFAMIDLSANLFNGHVQLQHREYAQEPRVDRLVNNAQSWRATFAADPGVVHVSPRTQAFALASSGERSFGALVVGVDWRAEARWVQLAQQAHQGRYLQGASEAYLGATLARNLGIEPGAELILLGTARQGGVAAHAAQVVGTFATGAADLDRTLVFVDLDAMRAAWDLGADDAHSLVALGTGVAASEALADRLRRALPIGSDLVVNDWTDLMPDIEQNLDLKQVGSQLFFVLIAIIVIFSVVNTLMMVVYERTREFGMLRALGLRPAALQLMLQLEALWLGLLGVVVGLLVSWALVALTARNGIPLPAQAEQAMAGLLMPDRFYPVFNTGAAQVAAVSMLLGTQLAAVLPGWRIRRLAVTQAMRDA